MNLTEKIRQRVIKFLGLEHLNDNPSSQRYTYINDKEAIRKLKQQEFKIWYIGDGDELLNFYTNQEAYGYASNPIYNRNQRNYFWSLSVDECKIKRVHSGIPNAIVTTLVNAVGSPMVSMENPELHSQLKKIIYKNDIVNVLNQQQMPLTMAEGYGAFKPIFDKNLSDTPLVQYYEAEDVEFVYKQNVLIAIIYKDYYKFKGKNYLLLETRRISKEKDSIVEYELYRLLKDNEVENVSLDTVPELAGLQPIRIKGLDKVLGVPSKFLFDPLNKEYGKSIYSGKVDLFDDLDQILSQDSQTVRVSTPVEYYNPEILERGANGEPHMPAVYNRQYIKKPFSMPDGDGNTAGNDIQTTQPILNFEQYSVNARNKLDMILTGLLSPATIGIQVAKKDNAEAQREKEKVTIMTRNNIIDRETKILNELFTIMLMLQEYLDTGIITIKDYNISIKFDEFANPSFENELQILGTAWSAGQISTNKYVEILWRDKLSDEDRNKEVEWLDNTRMQDNLELGDIDTNENGFNADYNAKTRTTKENVYPEE